MGQTGDQPEKDRKQYAFNLTLAAVAGQVGCLTLVFVLIALFVGLWLDSQFQTRPMFTILLMIGSVPVTLLVMFWVVRSTTARMMSESGKKPEDLEEESDRGRNS